MGMKERRIREGEEGGIEMRIGGGGGAVGGGGGGDGRGGMC